MEHVRAVAVGHVQHERLEAVKSLELDAFCRTRGLGTEGKHATPNQVCTGVAEKIVENVDTAGEYE